MWLDCAVAILSVWEDGKIRFGVTLGIQAANGYLTMTHFILIRALGSFDI